MSLNSPIVYNTFLILIMSDQLEMLTQREQLMEDIISIVDGMLENVEIDDVDKEMMIKHLCDATCRNFPAK